MPTGGQFAAMINPESTLDLATTVEFLENEWVVTPEGRVDRIATIYPPGDADAVTGYRLVHFNDELYEASQLRRADQTDEYPEPVDLTQPVKTNAEAVAWCEAELEKIAQQYSDVVDAGKSETPEAWDLRDSIEELRDQLVDHQRDLISEQREELDRRRKHFDLDEAIFSNVCASLEVRREMAFADCLGVDEDRCEVAQLSDEEIEKVRGLVDGYLHEGISRGSDKALGYLIEEETELIVSNVDFGEILEEKK